MPTAPFTAAAVQFEPTFGDKERNVSALLAMVEDAAAMGATLVVTPEMGTTGYCWFDREEVTPHVEPIPGPTTDRFAETAKRLGCHVVIGMPEVDPATGLYYNSAVLIGPAGIVGTHRKTHPYISEPKWAAAGDLGHRVFETPIGRIAILICMDIHFVETARLVAIEGADVICHISNWLAERTPAPYWMSRAFENGVHLVESNRWGLERGVQFSGGSCVIAPDATILASIDGGDGIVTAEIDPGRTGARRVFGEEVFADRRPGLYPEIMTNTFSWNPGDFFRLYGEKPLPVGGSATIAVGEFAPDGDIADNLRRIEALALEAEAAGAALLVLPEFAICGGRDPRRTAVSLDDPRVSDVLEIARIHRLHLVAGLAERDGATLYDTAILAGPEGLVGRYRKTHLTSADREWATPGDAFSVFDLPFGRLGLLIGHDAAFPEAGRILALRGCDVIACPSAIASRFHGSHAGSTVAQPEPIPTGPDALHWHHFRVRAGENNCFLAFANIRDPLAGYPGLSGIFSPDTFAFPRHEAIVSDNESLAVLAIDTASTHPVYPTSVVRRKDLVLMRQPHHYTALVTGSCARQGPSTRGGLTPNASVA